MHTGRGVLAGAAAVVVVAAVVVAATRGGGSSPPARLVVGDVLATPGRGAHYHATIAGKGGHDPTRTTVDGSIDFTHHGLDLESTSDGPGSLPIGRPAGRVRNRVIFTGGRLYNSIDTASFLRAYAPAVMSAQLDSALKGKAYTVTAPRGSTSTTTRPHGRVPLAGQLILFGYPTSDPDRIIDDLRALDATVTDLGDGGRIRGVATHRYRARVLLYELEGLDKPSTGAEHAMVTIELWVDAQHQLRRAVSTTPFEKDTDPPVTVVTVELWGYGSRIHISAPDPSTTVDMALLNRLAGVSGFRREGNGLGPQGPASPVDGAWHELATRPGVAIWRAPTDRGWCYSIETSPPIKNPASAPGSLTFGPPPGPRHRADTPLQCIDRSTTDFLFGFGVAADVDNGTTQVLVLEIAPGLRDTTVTFAHGAPLQLPTESWGGAIWIGSAHATVTHAGAYHGSSIVDCSSGIGLANDFELSGNVVVSSPWQCQKFTPASS